MITTTYYNERYVNVASLCQTPYCTLLLLLLAMMWDDQYLCDEMPWGEAQAEGMVHVLGGMAQGPWEFITLRGLVHNVKLKTRLFLEFST